MQRRLVRSVFWLALCLTGFVANSATAHDLSGCWDGNWQSCTTPHHGPLDGEFCRIDATHYQVNFHGRFFKVFPFRYSVVLTVVSEDANRVELAGSSDLGRLFGTFYYRAVVTGNSFVANYSSCKDSGQFILQRQCGGG